MAVTSTRSKTSTMYGFGIRLLRRLPTVEVAFGYGSGVFRQGGVNEVDRPQVDFLFAVDDPIRWHAENLKRHPEDYAGMARFGSRWVTFLTSTIGVGVHFNPFVSFEDRVVKYGVMSVDALLEDLRTWRYLYTSGRLHKPVMWLHKPTSIMADLRSNTQAALAAALLLSPSKITKTDLFRRICGLSYTGDIRMGLAEDRSKINNIVEGSFQEFDRLYSDPLQILVPDILSFNHPDALTIHPSSRSHLLNNLPKSIKSEIPHGIHPEEIPNQLASIIQRRVASSSRSAFDSPWHY